MSTTPAVDHEYELAVDIDEEYPNGHDIVRDEAMGHRIFRCQDCNCVFLTEKGIDNQPFCPV